mmetsp:Transcript_53260/g.57823  ORF Transcript_53260/g.57823 Transcript_53260/m.57823 type:complete len:176 (-) Transcript_53260:1898-2425(-)
MTTMKAYMEPAEETKKDSKDEREDEGADKKEEAENNQDTTGTIRLDAKNKNNNSDTGNQEFNTETEEATNMGANTEAINGESGLQQHTKNFHANRAAAAWRIKEVENMSAQLTNEEATDDVNEQNSKIDDGWDVDDDCIFVDEDKMEEEGGNPEAAEDDDEKNWVSRCHWCHGGR